MNPRYIYLSTYAILLCILLSTIVQAEELAAVAITSPQHITWDSDSLDVGLIEIQATSRLTPTIGWFTVGTVVPTATVASVRLNMTNDIAFYRVRAITSSFPHTRHEMALIPESEFSMGNEFAALNQGFTRELPVHPVPVSSFLMDIYEVTNDKLAEVFQWAYDEGLIGFTEAVVDGVTNPIARVVNLEGDQQVLYRVDRSWSEVTFTNGQFQTQSGREIFPVAGISWFGAAAYANYRSDMEGLDRTIQFDTPYWTVDVHANGYRLPTEAEWEKAARGGEINTHFPWPNDSVQGTNNYLFNIDSVKANYVDGRFSLENHPQHPWWFEAIATTPVGYYNGQQQIETFTTPPPFSGADVWQTNDMANAYGLYDMAGNVFEWCWDWLGTVWYENPAASFPDPIGETNTALAIIFPPDAPRKVLRGGAWDSFFTYDPSFLRCAYREGQTPDTMSRLFGFRLVRPIR